MGVSRTAKYRPRSSVSHWGGALHSRTTFPFFSQELPGLFILPVFFRCVTSVPAKKGTAESFWEHPSLNSCCPEVRVPCAGKFRRGSDQLSLIHLTSHQDCPFCLALRKVLWQKVPVGLSGWIHRYKMAYQISGLAINNGCWVQPP